MSFAHKVFSLGDATAGLPCKTEQRQEPTKGRTFFTGYCFVVKSTSV